MVSTPDPVSGNLGNPGKSGDSAPRAVEGPLSAGGRLPSALPVAIVGAGLMGRWHLHTARRLGARVVAVVDPNLDAAAALASCAPGAQTYPNLEGVLKCEKVFAAHICAPSQHHYELARMSALSGIHVLVEKPICQTADETLRLMGAARQAGVVVCPVHQYAFQRGVGHALRWLESLGKLRRISFDICSAGAEGMPPQRRIAVVDEILPHPISVLQRLLPGQQFSKLCWNTLRTEDGDFVASCATDGGILISISINLTARPTCFQARLQAELGSVEIDGFHGFAIRMGGRPSRFTKITAPFSRSFRTLTQASINLVRRGLNREPAYPGLSDLTQQFYEAARGGDPARMPISADAIADGAETRDRLALQRHETAASFV